MTLECDHIRNEFSALLDDELNPEDRELVEEHLADCSDCLLELHGYKQVSEAYRYHHPVKAPDDFEERFREALVPVTRRGAGMSWMPYGLAAAAAIAVIAGAIVWQLSPAVTDRFQLSQNQPEAATAESRSEFAPMVADSAEAPDTVSQKMEMESPITAAPEPAPAPPATAVTGGEPAVALQAEESAADVRAYNEVGPAPDQPSAPANPQQPEESGGFPDGLSRRVNGFGGELGGGGGGGDMAVKSAPAPVMDPPAAAPVVQDSPVREWRERSFELQDGIWQETTYNDEARTLLTVPSPAWNELLDRFPDLNLLYSPPDPVIVQLDTTWYELRPATSPPAE